MPASLKNALRTARHRTALDRFYVLGPFLALGLVLLLLWSLVAWFSLRYADDIVQDAERELQYAAINLAQETDAVFNEAESNLRTLNLMLLGRGASDTLADNTVAMLADALRENRHGLVDILLGDAQGQLYRIPSGAGRPYTSMSTQGLIQEMNADRSGATLVGTPLRLRPGGKEVIPVALKLSAPLGKVTMAIALIDVDSLRASVLSRLSRHQGVIALVSTDGLSILRVPDQDGFAGLRFGSPALWAQMDAADVGTLKVPAGQYFDQHERIAAFSHLIHARLAFIVSQTTESTLAAFHRQRLIMLGVAGLVSVVALLLTALLTQQQRKSQLSEAALRATNDASPMGLFRSDASGRAIYANETYWKILGIEPEELSWAWLQVRPAEERERAKQRWSELARSGERTSTIETMTRPDGQVRTLAMHTAPVLVGGRSMGLAGAFVDITDRMAEQDAARTLSAILELTPDYVCQIDSDGKVFYINPSLRKRIGYDANTSPSALSYRELFGDQQIQYFEDEILLNALQEGHWHGRATVSLGSDEHVPVDITVLAHKGDDDSIKTISLMLRDVSVEVRATRELLRSQAMQAAIAQVSPALISVLDREHRFSFVNRAFEKGFGLRQAECLGRHIDEMLGDDNGEQSRDAVNRALKGETVRLENTYSARATPLIVEMQYAPLHDEHGQIDGVICIGYDVTESRQEALRLRNASQTDPLTGLLNRAGFALQAAEQVAQAQVHGHLMAVLYLDLDRFKPVNDEFGHATGDNLLIAVAGRLRRALRPEDLLARMGGDEFAAVLPDLRDPSDAAKVADKLVRVVGTPFMVDKHSLHVGVSIGFCVCRGPQADLKAMVLQADAKLYEAKNAGRDGFRGSLPDEFTPAT